MSYIIKNATILNEGHSFTGFVKICGERIESVEEGDFRSGEDTNGYTVIDAGRKWLMPGAIDDQVHFREPGLMHKGDLYSESRAAVAGGITSFMEMPNTSPATVTQELLEDKFRIAADKSLANYSFFIGATKDNLAELLKTDPRSVCGIKIFMGSSTGNLLLEDQAALRDIFREAHLPIALHCEDDTIIRRNAERFRAEYGDTIPVHLHSQIRSEEACYRSSARAVELAAKYNTRIHILHISTARELELFRSDIPSTEKRVTAEACVHHLWFSDEDYSLKGSLIKWNPAVKKAADREALREAVRSGKIDVLATDHAPHTLQEKQQDYYTCPSGGPLVQHALPALFELAAQGVFRPELIVEKYCHTPADLFGVEKRGYIRPGYFADLVLLDPRNSFTVNESNILYKCGWSPFTGTSFGTSIEKTFVNGHLAYDRGTFDEGRNGQRLLFSR